MNTTSHASVGGLAAAPQLPSFTAPTFATTSCLICDNPIEHVGDIASRICDHCADAVETSRCPCGAEVTGPGSYCSTSCVRRYATKRVSAWPAESGCTIETDCAHDVEHGDEVADEPIVTHPAPNVLFAQHLHNVTTSAHEHRHDVDVTHMCCVCDNTATGVCKCGRKLCPGCGDEETGLCPHCEEV